MSFLFLFCGDGAGTEASCIPCKYSTTEILQCGNKFKPIFWEKRKRRSGREREKEWRVRCGAGEISLDLREALCPCALYPGDMIESAHRVPARDHLWSLYIFKLFA